MLFVALLIAGCTDQPNAPEPAMTTGNLYPGEQTEPPHVLSAAQLSADGTLLGVTLGLGCPDATVEDAAASETADTVDIEITTYQPEVTASELQRLCGTYVGRPQTIVPIRLHQPIADRILRINGAATRLDPESGTVPVAATLTSTARPDSLPSTIGVAFITGGRCYLVWPWGEEAVTFLSTVPVRPGGTIEAVVAPMENPAPGVVERCPPSLTRTTAIAVPHPPDPAAQLSGIQVALTGGFLQSAPEIDPSHVRIEWQYAP